ncbi:MAG TPA: potassium transporter TrkA [Aquifex aeolicus]|uniref:Potassium transporter TrkA n=1 Tax=Aquifex aeolicus TaxID=63363 RepID=A0A9D0YNW8_AQUAO|nr:potassium transporter TrkA [Aquificales bacterium]HIP98208.1 potassium transporter TrkA [Aquifex aeolicus]HIQ25815.1 potassium transporter TrkA [Aquifex aeolicus]
MEFFKQTELPGIGKRFSIKLSSGQIVSVIIHHSGKREIYVLDEEGDVECTVTLTDQEAREMGMVLAGAFYQPVEGDKMQMLLKQLVMEWVELPEQSPLIGQTLAEADIRKKTGAIVLGVVREGEIFPAPDPKNFRFKAGDIAIVVGNREQIDKFIKTYSIK